MAQDPSPKWVISGASRKAATSRHHIGTRFQKLKCGRDGAKLNREIHIYECGIGPSSSIDTTLEPRSFTKPPWPIEKTYRNSLAIFSFEFPYNF